MRGSDGERLFEPGFLDYLKHLKPDCKILAVPEGSLVFPHEPLLRLQGPIVLAQILETPLLNLLNFQTLIATKASRICAAAKGDPVLEFGLRRAQGKDGAMSASRAAFIGGCHATSNVLAGQKWGIPVKGTHAHSWVMAFDSELEAFQAYAHAMPNNCIFLVDTYDTLKGVERAVKVGQKLRAKGHEINGIRLDSGDLGSLSRESRIILDAGGFPDASIVASNDLDEYRIEELKSEGARIDTWGIGTRLVTAHDQPALGGVYKLAGIRRKNGDWQYKIKLSEQEIKISNPGLQRIRRYYHRRKMLGDMIYDENLGMGEGDFFSFQGEKVDTDLASGEEVMLEVFEGGRRILPTLKLEEIRTRGQEGLSRLPDNYRKLSVKKQYPVGLENRLASLKKRLIEKK